MPDLPFLAGAPGFPLLFSGSFRFPVSDFLVVTLPKKLSRRPEMGGTSFSMPACSQDRPTRRVRRQWLAEVTLSGFGLSGIDTLHSLPDAVLIEALLPDQELHQSLFICRDPLQGLHLLAPQDIWLCMAGPPITTSTAGRKYAAAGGTNAHP